MQHGLPVLALTLILAACSGERSGETDSENTAGVSSPNAFEPTIANSSDQATVTPPVAQAVDVLTLEGLDGLRVGDAIPPGSKWAERGAQASDTCRTVSSPDFPGVYAIVEGGKVRRITLGQGSSVKLAENIGVGADEQDVGEHFAGFRSEPHKYRGSPAKYLTAPNAASGDSALRFEIDEDGKVVLIHVGTMPVLGYVEGCA